MHDQAPAPENASCPKFGVVSFLAQVKGLKEPSPDRRNRSSLFCCCVPQLGLLLQEQSSGVCFTQEGWGKHHLTDQTKTPHPNTGGTSCPAHIITGTVGVQEPLRGAKPSSLAHSQDPPGSGLRAAVTAGGSCSLGKSLRRKISIFTIKNYLRRTRRKKFQSHAQLTTVDRNKMLE